MTSAKAGIKISMSKAAQQLEFAAGKKRVSLGELRPLELERLLEAQLDRADLMELRGFKELGEVLTQRGGDGNYIFLNGGVSLRSQGFSEDYSFSLKSHVARVCRGALYQKLIYRRHESKEETTDYNKAHEWGRDGYIYGGEEKLLLMRRLPELSYESVLVEVAYQYTKVPNKKEYLITDISAKLVPISGFCKHFGQKAPNIARDLLWELTSIHRQTVESLEKKTNTMRQKLLRLERLGDSIG